MEKEYMEKILVVPRKKLLEDIFFEGFEREKITYYLERIRKYSIFKKRFLVENDPNYKQIIPYLIIKFKNKYFMFQRFPIGVEDRLFHKYSVGIGGHINKKDVKKNKDLINSGLEREFNEELIYNKKFNYKILGLVNDDFDEVGKVHFGIVYLVEIETPEIKIRENSKMKGRLVDKEDLLKYKDKMERWSQILIDNLL
jgi:predicted NUDIX family phosphoesterase